MARSPSIYVVVLLALIGAPGQAQEKPANTASTDNVGAVAANFDTGLAHYFNASEPGATIIVTRGASTLFRKAYGMADMERKQALGAEMSLRIGSVTKQFTAVAVLMLAEQGKLSLDDDITSYIREFPNKGSKITIEHLLTHTSGISDFTARPGYGSGMDKEMTVADMIDSFKHEPLQFVPGERFAYSNSGYFLLGAIIEKVSGMSYAKFLERNIFEPLHMTHTGYEGFDPEKKGAAKGYSILERKIVPSSHISMSQPFAAGALTSSVDDLARWDAAISQGKLCQAGSWKKAFTSFKLKNGESTNYGYGWTMGELAGTPFIGHGGGIKGFSAYTMRLPAENIYVAVLSNLDNGPIPTGMIAAKAASIALGKPIADSDAAALPIIVLDAAVFDSYVGKYALAPGIVVNITREGGNFLAQATGQQQVRLEPVSATTFLIKSIGASLRFDKGGDGVVSQFVLFQGGREKSAARIN